MAGDDITNKQLLDALTQQLAVIADNMMTRRDIEEIVAESTRRLDAKIDALELRLGRRIDQALAARTNR